MLLLPPGVIQFKLPVEVLANNSEPAAPAEAGNVSE
jgi:hypothetical protein